MFGGFVVYNEIIAEEIIKNALKEDINYCDITTEVLIDEESLSEAKILAKEEGVVAGIPILRQVYKIIDPEVKINVFINDGEKLEKGNIIASVMGKTKSILKGERVALNFMQRLSGIAKKSRQFRSVTMGLNVKVVDTRKTMPNLRMFDKYAVSLGGCNNHRYNLSDSILIKDNHIEAVGSITNAIVKAKQKAPHTMKIEIEVQTIEQLKEALDTGVDIILLDNMSIEMLEEAVLITNKRAILEASGNVTLANVRAVAATGVDVISVGELTHSISALDISMLLEQ